MAMKPIQEVPTIPVSESSGVVEQSETKINCVFTYNNENVVSSEVPVSVDEIIAQLEYMNNDLFIDSAQITREILAANEGLSVANDRALIIELVRERKLEIIRDRMGIDISNLSEADKNNLVYAYDAMCRGIQEGMRSRNITSEEEYYATTTATDRTADMIDAQNAYQNSGLGKSVMNNADVQANAIANGDASRKSCRNASDAIERDGEHQQYYNDILQFVKDGKVKDIDVNGITDINSLLTSKNFMAIEYQYLQAKMAGGAQLSELEQKEYDRISEIANDNNGDLTNINLPSGGNGEFCANIKSEEKRLEALANGQDYDEYLENAVKEKLIAELKDLSPEEQQKRIAEILATAADTAEGALLLKALYSLLDGDNKIIGADVLNNALNDAGVNTATKAAFAKDADDEFKKIIAQEIIEETQKGNSPLTAMQFEAFWRNSSEEIQKLFSDDESCGSKFTELLKQAETEINAEKINSDSTTDASGDRGYSSYASDNNDYSTAGYGAVNIFGSQDLFDESNGVNYFGVATDPSGAAVVNKASMPMNFINPNSSSEDDVAEADSSKIIEEIKTTNDPVRRAELFTQLSDEEAIALVFTNPQKYIHDIKEDRLYSIIIDKWQLAMAGDVGLQRAYEIEIEQKENMA